MKRSGTHLLNDAFTSLPGLAVKISLGLTEHSRIEDFWVGDHHVGFTMVVQKLALGLQLEVASCATVSLIDPRWHLWINWTRRLIFSIAISKKACLKLKIL